MRKLLLLVLVGACSGNHITYTEYVNHAPTYVPGPPDKSLYRPLPINYNWTEGSYGTTINVEGFGAPKLSDEWAISTDTLGPIRAGWSSERFHIEPGWCYTTDCPKNPVHERIEQAESWMVGAHEGDEYWYSWSFYVDNKEVIGQYTWMGQFQQGPNWNPIWMFGKNQTSSSDFCILYNPVKTNNWTCTKYPNAVLIPDADFKGKWHDIKVHAIWSVNEVKGLTEIWVDGALTYTFQGKTRTEENSSVYLKYGIYRWMNDKPMTMYYDEIRKGKREEDVDIKYLTNK